MKLSRKISVATAGLLLLIVQCTLLAVAEPGTTDTGAKPLPRILVVTAPGQYGNAWARLIESMMKVQVDITDSERYTTRIDAYNYDGFVYLGGEYAKPPKEGFLEDMRVTRKPVFWVNYHAWLLGKQFFDRVDFTVRDKHDNKFASLVARQVSPMLKSDTTLIEANGDKVLYWFFRPATGLVPAAVRSGNITYLGYSPTTNSKNPDFEPFRKALYSAFRDIRAAGRIKASSFAERIEAIRKDKFRTGIHLPVYVAKSTPEVNGYDSDYWHDNLIRIKKAGAEWVNIVAIHYQEKVDSSVIYADPKKTPTVEALKAIVADAHKLGLYVRLYYFVNIAKPVKKQWRGFITPRNKARWWKSYNQHALKLARFAHDNNVEAFVIGGELNRMQTNSQKWVQLVRQIRKKIAYKGLLGYQVNFDSMTLRWSKMLDFVAVAAYWPLSKTRDPKLADMSRVWKKINTKLKLWKRRNPGVALEFGEIGYVSQAFSSVFPFSWTPHKALKQNMKEQLQCYKSLFEYLKNYREVHGVHFFASTQEDTDTKSIGYTPFGKPAQEVMKAIIKLR